MSTKLPLEIRRNYSIKDVGHAWTLKCIVCEQAWQLNKPEKGKSVHGGNVLHLLDHAASHPLPTEEDVAETPTPIVAEPAPVLVPSPQVNGKPRPYSVPTSKNPNAYKVERSKGVIRALHFRDMDYTGYGQVEHSDLGYSIVLFAANAKHASLVGSRLIQQFIDYSKKEVI